jgi:AcrR family transcriptional regulator
MIDPATDKGRIVSAALRLAAERPWSQVTMLDIAEASGAGLVALRKEFGSKSAILAAFIRMIDEAVLAEATRSQARHLRIAMRSSR